MAVKDGAVSSSRTTVAVVAVEVTEAEAVASQAEASRAAECLVASAEADSRVVVASKVCSPRPKEI